MRERKRDPTSRSVDRSVSSISHTRARESEPTSVYTSDRATGEESQERESKRERKPGSETGNGGDAAAPAGPGESTRDEKHRRGETRGSEREEEKKRDRIKRERVKRREKRSKKGRN